MKCKGGYRQMKHSRFKEVRNGGKLESGMPSLPRSKIFYLPVFGAFHTSYISPSVSLFDVCGWQVYSVNCRGGREGEREERRGCFYPREEPVASLRSAPCMKNMPARENVYIHTHILTYCMPCQLWSVQFSLWGHSFECVTYTSCAPPKIRSDSGGTAVRLKKCHHLMTSLSLFLFLFIVLYFCFSICRAPSLAQWSRGWSMPERTKCADKRHARPWHTRDSSWRRHRNLESTAATVTQKCVST